MGKQFFGECSVREYRGLNRHKMSEGEAAWQPDQLRKTHFRMATLVEKISSDQIVIPSERDSVPTLPPQSGLNRSNQILEPIGFGNDPGKTVVSVF